MQGHYASDCEYKWLAFVLERQTPIFGTLELQFTYWLNGVFLRIYENKAVYSSQYIQLVLKFVNGSLYSQNIQSMLAILEVMESFIGNIYSLFWHFEH